VLRLCTQFAPSECPVGTQLHCLGRTGTLHYEDTLWLRAHTQHWCSVTACTHPAPCPATRAVHTQSAQVLHTHTATLIIQKKKSYTGFLLHRMGGLLWGKREGPCYFIWGKSKEPHCSPIHKREGLHYAVYWGGEGLCSRAPSYARTRQRAPL